MAATPAALRLGTLAAAGLLVLTACAGPDAGTPPATSDPRSGTSSTANSGSPSSSLPSPTMRTASASPSQDIAQASLGADPYAVRALTVAGRPVAVPAEVTIDLSPDLPAFQAATSGLCGQPRWGVVVVDPTHWAVTGDVPQPAEGCPTDVPGREARVMLDRLADGAVAVARGDGGALTLTRDDVVLVLAPQR